MASLRDRKKDRTRAELVRCAVDLIKERGFDATTIDDITACAEYSRSTFFRYFASKEEVIVQTPVKRMETLVDLLEEAGDQDADPWTRLRSTLSSGAVALARDAGGIDHECVKLMLKEPSLFAGYATAVLKSEEVFAAYLSRVTGLPASDPMCAVTATAILGVLRTTMLVQFDDEVALRASLDRGFDLLEQGFRNAPDAPIRRLFEVPKMRRHRRPEGQALVR